MLNTAEFWVGVSFIICVGISFKLIVPKLKSGLENYQELIERTFLEAECTLIAAQKKFVSAKNQVDDLSQLVETLNHQLEAEINEKLNEWNFQKKNILLKYEHMQEHKLQNLRNHLETQAYNIITQAFVNVIEDYFKKHINSKIQQEMALVAIEKLPKI